MKKLRILFFALLLCACSLTFDPAGKLAQKQVLLTSTATIVQVKHLAVSPTGEKTCAVTGDLNLRAAPNAAAKVVDWLLSGDSVVATGGETAGWRAVRNGAGVAGYVNVKWLRCEGW